MTTPAPGYVPTLTSEPWRDFGISNEMILRVAAVCRSDDTVPFIVTDAGPVPFILDAFAYWPVQYSDGARVMVKVPHLMDSPFENGLARGQLKQEEHDLRFLALRGFPWSPRLIYSTMEESNSLLGRPYIIHTMPPGNRLQWDDVFPAEKANREKVLAQIARIIFDLAALDRLKYPPVSPVQWLQFKLDYQIMNSLKSVNKICGVTPRSYMILRVLLHLIILDHTTRMPMVYAKYGLDPRNIFIDNDFNVTGLVGWHDMVLMPMRFAFRLPWFLTLTFRANPPMSSAPVMAHAPTKVFLEQVPLIMRADREYFASRMQYEYATRATPLSVGHLSPSGWEMMCCDLQDLDWNHLIFEGLHNRRMHGWLIKRNFLVAGLQRWVPHDSRAVWTMPETWREAWNFFREHKDKMGQLHNTHVTDLLLWLAIERRLPWGFIEMMLIEAFGRPRR